MGDNYVVMHLHSMFSNGVTNVDSITDYKEYIARAKELGMKAMCFTEHGSVFSWLHKKEEIEKAGMKYIHGIEAYVTETLFDKVRDNYHCVLIAKNYDGVLELNTLVSNSFNRQDGHFYYVPRITLEELENTSENIIVSTACLGGILNKGTDTARDRFVSFLWNNKDRCFLEIQHHMVEDQIKYNQYLYNLSKSICVPLITGTDTHALNSEHLEGRSILQKAKNVNFADEQAWDLTFKSYDELVAAYEKQKSLPMDVVLTAINNTNVLADMVEEFAIDRSYKYPHLWENPEQTFRQKIAEGIKWRGVDKYPNYQEYLDRIEYEMKAYIHNQAIDFMLLMDDIISWCKTQDIQVGYGRGSVNGSVIAWLLGITEMDSIKHKLNFDRFMNVERVSLSDIDTDFPPSRIEDVKNYLFNRHGLYCSDIITFNTIADKGAIRDVGRALNIPLDTVGEICDAMDNEERAAKMRQKYPELFRYVDLVKGTIVSIGSHPCGTIVCGFEFSDKIGVCSTATSNYRVSQLNMKEVDSLNFVKLDLLKLDTIELINETCKLAGIERPNPSTIDDADVKVWNSIRDDTTSIFQWESNSSSAYLKQLFSNETISKIKAQDPDFSYINLFAIGNGAIRPAGESYRDALSRGEYHIYGNEALDKFMAPTLGYCVYQEEIIEFLHTFCGYTMGMADLVRRGFAKKTGTDKFIPDIKAGFIKTMKENYGVKQEEAEKLIVTFIRVIEDASDYLFSQNHSKPYSYEGYVCGYLRTYYPLEFMTTALNVANGNEEKTRTYTMYAKSLGITFKPPEFGHSRAGYYCNKEENAIYKGIGSLKFMTEDVSNEIAEMYDKPFNDFVDVLYYMHDNTTVNSRQIDILIKIDFFKKFGDINKLLYINEMFQQLADKRGIKKDKAAELGITEEIFRRFSEKETLTRVDEMDYEKYCIANDINFQDVLELCSKYKYDVTPDGIRIKIPNGISFTKFVKAYNVTDEEQMKFATKIVYGKFDELDIPGLLKYLLANANIRPCSLSERLKYQINHLGYVDYIDPEIGDNRHICVTALDTTYSPKFQAYNLRTGETCELKVHGKSNGKDRSYAVSFQQLPFENGDVLLIKKCSKKLKQKKSADGKWVEVPGEFNWWLDDYSKIS